MSRFYATRESVKAAAGIQGSAIDAVIDGLIESASETAEETLGRSFIPVTETRYYPWPQPKGKGTILHEPKEDILAITLLQADAQGTPVTITDFFLEPVNDSPFRQIEIDLSSDAAFESGDTSQRSIAATGRFGYSENTKAAGLLDGNINASVTSLDVTDASLVGVGDTLLLGTESIKVTERSFKDTTANVTADLTESGRDVTVTVNDGTLVNVNEVILVGSERMLVTAITGNDLTVDRAYDGSVLAAHSQPVDVYAARTLTVVRADNGTTAAAHTDQDAILKYAPAAKVSEWVRAQAILGVKQGASGYTGQIGGEGTVNVNANEVDRLEKKCIEMFGVVTF